METHLTFRRGTFPKRYIWLRLHFRPDLQYWRINEKHHYALALNLSLGVSPAGV
jgi:hypothetical protein